MTLPAVMAAFFMLGLTPRNGDICSFFLYRRVTTLQTACCGPWPLACPVLGVVNSAGGLLVGQPAASRGIKQLMAGGGIIVLGTTLTPCCPTLVLKGGGLWVFSPTDQRTGIKELLN